MTPQQIINKLENSMLALQNGNIQLKTLGVNKANAERDYKIALNKKILRLKAEKLPATIIMEVSKGDEEVAQLRLERDIAESSYFVCLDALNNLRLEIETLRSMLTWLRAEYKNS